VSGSRFRDVPRCPEKALLLLHISDSGDAYRVLWGGTGGGAPTMELVPHLKVHASLLAAGSAGKAVLHTHPVHLIAATHLPEYGTPGFDGVLEVSLFTARVFLPAGIGMVGVMPMGSEALADATVETLRGRKAVLWQRHGCLAVGADVFEAFDLTDMLEKAAQMFLLYRSVSRLPGQPEARPLD
jgi:rhamnulose-1-phosphate aldolase